MLAVTLRFRRILPLVFLLAGFTILSVRGPLAAAEPPNIVFLISDDQDFEHFGFMGHPDNPTPNLDRLAGRGTLFTTGHLPASVCRPSLASFLTGQYPHQSGIYANYLQNPKIGGDTIHSAPARSIANLLRQSGYATYGSGKFWEGDARQQGFTHGTVEQSFKGFYDFVRNGQSELMGFVDHFAGREPMFIWWAPLLPHTPHNPPQQYLDRFPKASIEVPNYVPPERRESFLEDEQKLLAMTRWMDDGVGRLVEKLRENGELENTLFVFAIDNGWANGLPSKHSVHEKSLRTPVFFTWPGHVQPERRHHEVVSTMDLYPTMLDFAGVEVPEHAVGQSLRPVLEGQRPMSSDVSFGAIYPHHATGGGTRPEQDVMALYRRGDKWKLVWYLRDFTTDTVGVPNRVLQADFEPHDAGDVDLFDLHADPFERTDLASKPALQERIARYKQDMLRWWRSTGGQPIDHLPAAWKTSTDATSDQADRVQRPTTQPATTESAVESTESSSSRPNVLVILADDLGYGDLSCYGAERVQTPNIDRLASEGMRFTDGHSPSSVCTPSRYNLITGRYAWRTYAGSTGVWANDPLIVEPWRETVASLLKKAGYHTSIIGKWHLGFGRPGSENWDPLRGVDWNRPIAPGPLEVGFDESFVIPHVGQRPHFYIRGQHVEGLEKLNDPIAIEIDPGRPQWHRPYLMRPREAGRNPAHRFHHTEPLRYQHENLAIRLTEEAVDWIEQYDRPEPFFLYFAHRNIHTPCIPNERFRGKSELGIWGDFILELDWSVGEVLNVLERKGKLDNTLVIFSSDNGGIPRTDDSAPADGMPPHRPNGPLRGHKTLAHEGGHRVPFLVRWPGKVKAGVTNSSLVALTDLMATFAELTGQSLTPTAGVDSFSFLPTLLDQPPTSPVRPSLVMDGNYGRFSLRRGPWKLIECRGGGGYFGKHPNEMDADTPPGQLYNVALDPDESENLYESQPEVVASLRSELETIRRAGHSRPIPPQ